MPFHLLTVQVLDVESAAGGTYNIRLFIESGCIVGAPCAPLKEPEWTGKPQQGRHDVRRESIKSSTRGLILSGKRTKKEDVHGLGVRGILQVFRMLATPGLSRLGRKANGWYSCPARVPWASSI